METQPAKGARFPRGVVGHDIVVIGASTGGVEALSKVVQGLPPDLPAAVFVVQHTSPDHTSVLPEILSRRGGLRATHALHGETIEPGRIYVAPPDNHLIVRSGAVSVVRGPRENGHRPSVDALFRSAAQSYGPRVIGVVLTGHLDCGTAGALSIKSRHGLVVVQDPEEAVAGDMPLSVLRHVTPDHVVPIAEMAALITHLVATPADGAPAELPRNVIEMEGDELGVPVTIVCPMCDGAITESSHQGFQYYRCHVGHAFSGLHMTREQEAQVERGMWGAVRAIEESAFLFERLAAATTGDRRARHLEKAAERRQQLAVLKDLFLQPESTPPANAESSDPEES